MPDISSRPGFSPQTMVVTAAVVAAAMLAVAAGGLWAHYGTAVFYEVILAGIAACF